MAMISASAAMHWACVLYTLPFFALLSAGRWRRWAAIVILPAAFFNVLAVAHRYYQAWPLLPMHLGPVALPLCLALLYPFATRTTDPERYGLAVRRYLLALNLFLVLLTLLFPKDFYLPFIKSKSLFAHAFLWFGLFGKGCFAVSAVWALAVLTENGRGGSSAEPTAAMNRSLFFAAWGFTLWTVAMFSGEIW